jgi:hypothetical protein
MFSTNRYGDVHQQFNFGKRVLPSELPPAWPFYQSYRPSTLNLILVSSLDQIRAFHSPVATKLAVMAQVHNYRFDFDATVAAVLGNYHSSRPVCQRVVHKNDH